MSILEQVYALSTFLWLTYILHPTPELTVERLPVIISSQEIRGEKEPPGTMHLW